MPKPDLMALTGGYRKTPVLQHGAGVIAIPRLSVDFLIGSFLTSLFILKSRSGLAAAVHWTDTFLFKVSVAVAFQPRAQQQMIYSVIRQLLKRL